MNLKNPFTKDSQPGSNVKRKNPLTAVAMLIVMIGMGALIGVAVPALDGAKQIGMDARNRSVASSIEVAKIRYLRAEGNKEWPTDEAHRWDAILPFLYLYRDGVKFKPDQPKNMTAWPIKFVIGGEFELPTVETAENRANATVFTYTKQPDEP